MEVYFVEYYNSSQAQEKEDAFMDFLTHYRGRGRQGDKVKVSSLSTSFVVVYDQGEWVLA